MRVHRLVHIPRRSRCIIIILLLVFFQLCSIFIYSISSSANNESKILSQLDNFDFTKARTFVNNWFYKNQDSFNKLLSKKIATIDLSDKKYWKFQNALTNTQLDVPIERFTDTQKLLHYDPRFTYSIYLNYIKNQFLLQNPLNEPTLFDDSKKIYVPFQWSDWVDLTLLNDYIVLPELKKPNCDILYPTLVKDRDKIDGHPIPGTEKLKERKIDPLTYCTSNDKLSNEFMVLNNLKDTSLFPGFNVIESGPKGSVEKKRLQAKSFLYSTFDNPSSILFLSDEGIYEVFTDKRQHLRSSELMSSFLQKNAIESPNFVTLDPVKEFQDLREQIPAQNFLPQNKTFDDLILQDENMRLPLNESFFTYDYQNIIEKYESYDKLTSKQQSHYDGLRYSAATSSMRLSKHFKEVALVGTSNKESGAHYDWRFFNGFVSLSAQNEMDDVAEKKRIILHRLLRNWLQFTYKTNIITWIAHGSLLSWYWDGISFPWDVDIDVQMPISELDRFSLMFNNSLIVENINEGFGKFYVDCSSYLTHRTKGNGRNNIDARFVDVDSGFYIDITGLTLTNTQIHGRYREQIDSKKVEQIVERMRGNSQLESEKVKGRKAREEAAKGVSIRYLENESLQAYNCRNNHFYLLRELSPLRISLIEGTKTLVPNNFKDILRLEYTRGMTVTTFNKHVYLPQIRLWLPFDTIYHSLKEEVEFIHAQTARRPSKSNRVTSSKIIKLMKLINEDMLLKLLQDEDILKEYYLTNKITNLHQIEMENITSDTMTREFITDNILNSKFKPLRKDMFYFSQQVGNYGEIKTKLEDENYLFNEILKRIELEQGVPETDVENKERTTNGKVDEKTFKQFSG